MQLVAVPHVSERGGHEEGAVRIGFFFAPSSESRGHTKLRPVEA